MKATVLNTKIGDTENEIHDYARFITTPEFNEFTCSVFDANKKQANLAMNSNVNNVLQRANKKKEKIEKLNMFNLLSSKAVNV